MSTAAATPLHSSLAAADLLAPRVSNRVLYEIGLLLTGTALLTLSAQAAIHLPFSPVPITGQTFAVLTIGMLYGAMRGGATVLAYLAQGAAGLPVFAGGGATNTLLGPTAGYLIAFVAAATLVGFLAERGWDRRISTTLIAMILGTIVIFIGGVTVLAGWVGPENAVAMGLTPYLPGAAVKIAAAAAVLPLGWKLLHRSRD